MVLFAGLTVTLAGCGGGSSDTVDTGSSTGSAQTETPVASESDTTPTETTTAPTESDPVTKDTETTTTLNRTAVLSWSAPSTRVNGDGISMGELDSYVIRYGRDQDNLVSQVEVPGAQDYATMEYVVDNLSEGTWYFTVQVRDSGGLLSAPSAMVSKTI